MMKRYRFFGVLLLIAITIAAASGCQSIKAEDPEEIIYELDEKNVIFDEVVIPYYLIDNIQDVPEIPRTELIEGIETDRYKKGLFEMEGIGPVNLYVQDHNWKMLLIEHSGEYYGITPGTGESFEAYRYNLIVAWELTYK